MDFSQKPLFIPLNSNYYDEFKYGTKDIEWRKLGPRWNEKTCRIDRPVVLSKGYGKQNRMLGVVLGFSKYPANIFAAHVKETMLKIYGDLDFDVACIKILIVDYDYKPKSSYWDELNG